MLDAEERIRYEAESQQLRLDLKTWETEWARDHDGAKPGRADIKQHSEIAQKYTAYNRVRSILSGKAPPSEARTKDTKREARKDDDSEARRKRKTGGADATADATAETPTKRLRPVETPQKKTSSSSTMAAADAVTPSISRRLFSPVVPTSIGPTPQRDGRVLGLFDFLAEEASEAERRRSLTATPSKRNRETAAQPTAAAASASASASATLPSQPSPFALSVATPRKQTLSHYGDDEDDDDDVENGHRRLGRTPMSSAKRNLLDRFTAGTAGTTERHATMSPLRARDTNAQQGDGGSQQGRAQEQPQRWQPPPSPLPPFATPTFLRRAPAQLAVDENGEFLSPPGRLRLPRKPLVRGLSSVLASLRQSEDDRLDEELDVLRELEAEEEGGPPTTRPKDQQQQQQQQQQQMPESDMQVQDSQRLLGGFDDEGLYDSAPEDQMGRDGQPLRVYKKKGQKRTTRLVYMRPTRTKRPVADSAIGRDGSDSDEEEEEEEAVPETQCDGAEAAGDDGSDREWSDGEEEACRATRDNKTKAKRAKAKTLSTTATAAAAATATADGTENKAGPARRVARKVNELAHANFKRLKLRNTGSKGGPGFNSRFRRKR